ncbi:MAG: kynureninase [Saprospiraceae bacterium]
MNNPFLEKAQKLDAGDRLAGYRELFFIPKNETGEEAIYLCGNSLGLMPKKTQNYLQNELDDWSKLGVEGHIQARHPWLPYHEFLTDNMAYLVGAKSNEVVVMNSLTVNLHLLMVSFYRPTSNRYKILVEYSPFPSDRYAVESQAKFHGFDPASAIIELKPTSGTDLITIEQIEQIIEKEGDQIALILIGGVNYYTGQAYPIKEITRLGHAKGCIVGFDLAHAVGNLLLNLHDDGPDFAAWCNYKYVNSGPGALSGVFVHERHEHSFDLPRFCGWWGHDKTTRFKMDDTFIPMAGAEGWQLSNPPIFSMTPILASLEIFKDAGMKNCRDKSVKLTTFLLEMLDFFDLKEIEVITPKDENQRGSQISLRMLNPDKSLFEAITKRNVIADWREPDVIRIAPVPLYNSFVDIYHFVDILEEEINS